MAGYAIIDELGEVTVENTPLDLKLACAAEFLLGAARFDQCAIYIWDRDERVFTLRASSGVTKGLIDAYGVGVGVPGAISGGIRPFLAGKTNRSAASIGKITDAGMIGFRTALAYPLRTRAALHGVLYFKALRQRRPNAALIALLGAAASQLVTLIRCAEVFSRHQKVHSELLELQTRMLSLERVMALADMAANIAHEIKNPLLSIGGLASRLKKHLPENSPGRPYLEQITHETVRLEKIIGGILRSLQDSAVELQPDDMNEIVNESLDIFREEAEEHGVQVVQNLHKGGLPVMADRDQLKIAFDNLIANALQSMENGGILTVSTCRENDSVIVRVADSGGGIDPRYVSYIFNPFFTTKKHGTGLGLPITNSIVMRHKGVLEVNNNIGEGVTFTVRLHFINDGGPSA